MIEKVLRFLPIVVFGLLLAGCNGDSTGSGGNDLGGVWYGEGFYNTGDKGEPIHMEFTMALDLVHSGTLVQGSYTVVRPVRGTMTGSIAGTVAGSDIRLTMNPHGRGWGTVADGVMSLTWIEGDANWVGLTGTVTLGRR